MGGAFYFLDDDETTLVGKREQAFRSGFLGVGSFGFTSLVQIAHADDDEVQEAIDRLAHHLLKHFGAPHLAAALPAAAAEIDDASQACEHSAGTLLAIERDAGSAGIIERLKIFTPTAGSHDGLKLWQLDPDAVSPTS